MGIRKKSDSAVFCCLSLFLAARVATAQERFRIFSTENGLPSNSVLAVTQTTDGYLWFTTYGGLVRFDGVHFQVFDSTNTPAIHGITFATGSLFQDSHGALWAGSWNSGAIRYQNGIFTSFTTRNGLPDNSALRIDEDAQRRIWIFTATGLATLENGVVKTVSAISGESVKPYFNPPSNLSGDLYLFGLWRFRNSTLERFAFGKWSQVPLPSGINPQSERIAMEIEDSQHRLWFSIPARPKEAFCFKDRDLTVFRDLPAGAFVNYRDHLGRLWITDNQGQTATWQDGRTSLVRGVSSVLPYRVLEDREGGIWLGTISQGLAHSEGEAIHMIRLPGGARPNLTSDVTQDKAGEIWVGGYALTRFHDRHPYPLLEDQALSGWSTLPEYLLHHPLIGPRTVPTAALWAEPDGGILLGDGKGVRALRNGKFLPVDPLLRSINTEITAILRDHSGTLWLGSEKGLYQYQNSSLRLFNAQQGVRGEVRALYEDRVGTLWIGTDDLLCRYRGSFSCFGDPDPLSHWAVHSITADKDGVVWVGTGRGILRIQGNKLRWIQQKDGLYANHASAILEDANGYFWISSHVGIYRVRRSDLNDLVQGRIGRVVSTYFSFADGLSIADTAATSHPAGLVARDGTLWFPTREGVAVIDPTKVPVNHEPPPVRIEGCFSDQVAIPCDRVSLRAGAENLEIRYTALDLRKSDQLQFRYRMDGLDDSWLSVGTRRVAYYPHLNPGTYSFLVTAANSDGVWNPTGARLSVYVAPHFYQSLWFQLVSVAIVLALFGFAWRIRSAEFQRRQALQQAFARKIIESHETERARIAGELHDGLGLRLALIKNMALLLNRSHSRTSQQTLEEEIAVEASSALSEVRQISENLRPPDLDLLGLTKAIEILVGRMCDGTGIKADVLLDDVTGAFEKNGEIHFYRIVQECLSNIIKHSQATSGRIWLSRDQSLITLLVADDGIGFDPGKRRTDKPGGFGLTGLSERVRLLGGKLSISSAPGEGVKIIVKVAFRPPAVELPTPTQATEKTEAAETSAGRGILKAKL